MFIYNLLLILLTPLLLGLIFIDGYKRSGGLIFLKQRLGFGLDFLPGNAICIHCASIGELKAAEPLINAISYPIIITTNTPTAARIIQDMPYKNVQWCYLPWDGIGSVRRFIKKTKPKQLWIMETEIWPNLYKHANNLNIPIYLLNARLSSKTLKTPYWIKSIYKTTLLNVKLILARNNTESKHFQTLGISKEYIKVLGNLKFSFAHNANSITTPNPINRKFVLLASSHEPEEYEIAKLWLELKRKELLVIVPRHNTRSKHIQKKLSSLTHNIALQTESPLKYNNIDILLVNTMGQLMLYYKYAEVIIMGGSFIAKGGHNILEPASLAKPIITGYDMSDFIDETHMLKQANGLIQVKDYVSITPKLIKLLDNKDLAIQQGKNAKKSLESKKNILERYLVTLGITTAIHKIT